MYCNKCGAEIMDEALICPKCGCSTIKKEINNVSGTQTAAKIFMIISAVMCGMLIFPLIWTIPMICSYSKKIRNGETVSTAFKVCTLLFVNLIAGILMFCDPD